MLPSFFQDVKCLMLNMMELDGALLVELEEPNIHFKNSTAMSLSRNHDSVTQEDLQTTM